MPLWAIRGDESGWHNTALVATRSPLIRGREPATEAELGASSAKQVLN